MPQPAEDIPTHKDMGETHKDMGEIFHYTYRQKSIVIFYQSVGKVMRRRKNNLNAQHDVRYPIKKDVMKRKTKFMKY